MKIVAQENLSISRTIRKAITGYIKNKKDENCKNVE
jgi:hypothetical protein